MATNNVKNVKFLRNGSLFATREAARTALTSFELTYEKDGTAILARYGSDNDVKTIVGYVYADENNHKSITIFDTDEATIDSKGYIDSVVGSGVTTANTATKQLEALSGSVSDTSATTSVAGAKKYTDDKIAETIDGLDVAAISAPAGAFIKSVSQSDGKVSATTADMPTVSVVTESGKPIIAVSETKGTIAASAGTINAEYVNITDSGSLIAATTVEGALAEIAAEIDAMDLAVVSGDGKVIVSVSETDGKVSATTSNVKDLQLGGYSKSDSTGAIVSGDTLNEALSKLENKAVTIASGEKVIAKDSSNNLYTNISLSGVTPSSTTVKEEYSLIATDGSVLGDSIKIYKDSSVVSIEYSASTQTLYYTYIDVSGATQTAEVDMSELVLETEFGSGVTVTNHVAHGVVDSSSESFLTVGAGGFKLSGVQNAINNAVGGLDADKSGSTAHVGVRVVEVDGKISAVTVSETNIADADKLNEISGKTITNVASSNSSITPVITSHTDGTKTVDLATDASKVKMTGFTSDVSGFTSITSSSTVTEAVKAIENEFISNEHVVSSALNDINSRTNDLSGKTITEVSSPNGSITLSTAATSNGTVAVSASTDASKISGLTAVASVAGEISGVSASDSVQTGINNLYASLAAEISARKAAISSTTVSGSNAIDVSRSSSGDTVSLKLDGTTTGTGDEKTGTDNALTITNNGLFLSTVWECGTY